MHLKPFTLSLISASIIFSNMAMANPSIMSKVTEPAVIQAYWTPERMQSATPMDLPQANPNKVIKVSVEEMQSHFKGSPEGKEGFKPAVEPIPEMRQMFEPITSNTKANNLDAGTLNQLFTSAQLTPASAFTSYPYRTAGKVFFTTPAGNKYCSGVLIAQRIVLTAGHCVHNGNGLSSGWYSNWSFVPAFNNGSAPYLTWNASAVYATGTWVSGGGGVPNAGDWATLELADQVISGATTKIGNYVGYLGWLTLSTIPNHATMLGYSGQLDSGQILHQVTAESAVAVAPNNAEYGSDMNIGAGGGPWIQNFGNASVGQTGGTNPARNRVIAVASYGYNDTTTLSNGASILNSDFVSLYNTACARLAGNC